MSLFKIRTFWTAHCDEEESFDQSSLTVAKLQNEDTIVTGSHSGILRIFKPSGIKEYNASDLLIETILKQPVLQLSSGRLVSGSPKIQLAVLHPNFLSVYALITKEGAVEHGVQNILQLLYEHKLRRPAYNFCVGPFGGTQNRDFICVQSLDGLLTFFEQESFAFCCFLPDFLLPNPIVFVKKSDSFVTGTSSWHVVSFRYKFLSEAGQNSVEDDNAGKKIIHDWKYSVGEAVIDLDVVEDANTKENYVLVLAERNIFCLNDSGKLKQMKRLEISPICFTNYFLNDRIMSLVVSETNNLLIYQNTSLKWCAQLQSNPVAVKRATLHNLGGVLVFLSQEGILECAYLGTEPSLFVAPPLAYQDLDFEEAGKELATLYKAIKNSYSNDMKVTNTSAERELSLSITVNQPVESPSAVNNKQCSIRVDIKPQGLFEEVQVVVVAPRPLKVEPEVEFFENLSEQTVMSCRVFVDGVAPVATLKLQVVASFISSLGVPRSVTRCAMLPADLVLETCPPLKDSDCKVTLSINQSPATLAELFPEYDFSGSAAAFKDTSGETVTILLAKSSERYRLQSSAFASLNLLIEQIVERLRKHYANKSDFVVTFNPPLPINELLLYINRHFTARQRFNSVQEQLSQLTAQFRLIQKRLISKFKIKNPTPLSNLELLLDDTFAEITAISKILEEEKSTLERTQTELSCALHVVLSLVKLMDCNNNVAGLIESALNPAVQDLERQDVLDASLCYLLRTVLAKSEKDKLRSAHANYEEVKDVSKVEKRLGQVLERLPKGDLIETHFPVEEKPEEEKDIVPVGSQFGESSSRLLSARKSARH